MADTATKVIDASALVVLRFAEERGSTATDQNGGHQLVAPTVLDIEIANVCLSNRRRQPARLKPLSDAFAGRKQLKIETIRWGPHRVLALAPPAGLSDACHLHLAQTLEVELVTPDRQLAEAAEMFL